MSEKDPQVKLSDASKGIDVPDSRISAFLELAYTAFETGLIPFSIRRDCAKTVLQLALMAEKFESSGVPDEFRM